MVSEVVTEVVVVADLGEAEEAEILLQWVHLNKLWRLEKFLILVREKS